MSAVVMAELLVEKRAGMMERQLADCSVNSLVVLMALMLVDS